MQRLLRQNKAWVCLSISVALITVHDIRAQELEADPATNLQQTGEGFGRADDPGAQTVVLGMTLEEGDGRPKVTDVAAASPAWDAGIRKGDIITSIDGLEHSSVKSYVDWLDGVRKIVADKKDGQSLAVELNRNDTHLELRAQIPESRIEEAREMKKEEELAMQEQPQYPAEQPAQVPQQPAPHPGGGYGNGDVGIGIGNGFNGGGGVGNGRNRTGMDRAMAQLFLVNGGNGPLQPNLPTGASQFQNQPNRPNPLRPDIDPTQPSARGSQNIRTQGQPATINQGQGDTLQQRLDAGAQQSGQTQVGAAQQTQQQVQPRQRSAEVEQSDSVQGLTPQQDFNAGGGSQRIPDEQNSTEGNQGMGGPVGTAMFQDQRRGLLAAVDVLGLPPGNYFVGISDPSAIQAGNLSGGTTEGEQLERRLPGNQSPIPQLQQQQRERRLQQERPGTTQPGATQPRGNVLFGGTEFFVNAQAETPDESPILEPAGDNIVPAENRGAPDQDSDGDQLPDDESNAAGASESGMDGAAGAGGFVRIGFLQVGQDGVGRLRQRIDNVLVDQIVGMAVVVHSTDVAPNQNEGAQTGASNINDGTADMGSGGSLLAAGIIQLVHPQGADPTMNAGMSVQGAQGVQGTENANAGQNSEQQQQQPAATGRRPGGQTSDSRINQ